MSDGSGQTFRVVAKHDYAARRGVELSFAKNDVLTVVARRGVWWEATLAARRGLIPSNYVRVLGAADGDGSASPAPGGRTLRAVVRYDYVAQRDVELCLRKGTVLRVDARSVAGKWWTCTAPDGTTGKAPRNYLALLEDGDGGDEESAGGEDKDSTAETKSGKGRKKEEEPRSHRRTASVSKSTGVAPAKERHHRHRSRSRSSEAVPPPPSSSPPPPPETPPPEAPVPPETLPPETPPPETPPPPPPPVIVVVTPPEGTASDSEDAIPPPPPEDDGVVPPPPEEEGEEGEDSKGAAPSLSSSSPPPVPPPRGKPPQKEDKKEEDPPVRRLHAHSKSVCAQVPAGVHTRGAPAVYDDNIPPPLPPRQPPTRAASHSFCASEPPTAADAADVPPPPVLCPPAAAGEGPVRPPGLRRNTLSSSSPVEERRAVAAVAAVAAAAGAGRAEEPPVPPPRMPPPPRSNESSPALPAAAVSALSKGRAATLVSRRPRPRGAIPLFVPPPGSAAAATTSPALARSHNATPSGSAPDDGGAAAAADAAGYQSMMSYTAEHVPRLTTSLMQEEDEARRALAIPAIASPCVGALARRGNATPGLGLPPAPALPQTPVTPGRARYIFAEADTPGNVRISAETHTLQAATLPKLVAKLTDRRLTPENDVRAFVMMHRNFADAAVVLDLLAQRFDTPPRMSDAEAENVQMRVCFVLRAWLTLLPDDFADSPDLAVRLRNLLALMAGAPRPAVSIAAANLRRICTLLVDERRPISALRNSQKSNNSNSGSNNSSSSSPNQQQGERDATTTEPAPPKIIAPPSTINRLLDISPVEAARQLTLLRHAVFAAIRPREFCNLAWTRKDAARRAPNVLHFIRDFNNMGSLVTCTVLSQSEPRARQKYLKYFLAIAQECRELRNYSTMMEITAALTAAPLARLARSWTPKLREHLDQFGQLSQKNFHDLRSLTANAAPPCVPYLCIAFADLVFIEEGNPNYLPDNPELINWEKAKMSFAVIAEVQRFQAHPYALQPCPAVSAWLTNILAASNMPDTQAYQMSLSLEPRETKN